MAANLTNLKTQNETRWKAMHVDPRRVPAFDVIAQRLIAPAAKAHYVGVQEWLRRDGFRPVPRWFVAMVSVHEYGGRRSGTGN